MRKLTNLTFRGLSVPWDGVERPELELVSPTTNLSPEAYGSPDKSVEAVLDLVSARNEVKKHQWPAEFMAAHNLPASFGECPEFLKEIIVRERNINRRASLSEAAAWLVSMDHPFDLSDALIAYYMPEWDFVTGFVQQAKIHATVAGSLYESFRCKFWHMEARPVEKLAYITEMDVEKCAKEWEAYPHPNHPAYPAGHGAAAEGSMRGFINQSMITDSEALKDIEIGCKTFAAFRSFSFMHVMEENLAAFKKEG